MSETRFIDDAAHRSARLAISQLFLDTDLDEFDLKSIARELLATGLPVDVLQRIYETEVAPACWRNLSAAPGGVWTAFDGEALSAEIERSRIPASSLNVLQRWRVSRWTAATRFHWIQVCQLLGSSEK